jgi:hypothetical protein
VLRGRTLDIGDGVPFAAVNLFGNLPMAILRLSPEPADAAQN